MDCKTDESYNLKRNLGFRLHDVINTKEQTVTNSIKDALEGENIQTQYSVIGYRTDLYFHEHKLATEVDELGHADRNLSNETERQKALEKELDCVFIRTDPEAKKSIDVSGVAAAWKTFCDEPATLSKCDLFYF